jgi:uncharacterized repeat protein (TIGR03833 family)
VLEALQAASPDRFRSYMVNTSATDGAKPMNGTKRANLTPGVRVAIVLKQDQRSGKRTEGVIKDILTRSPTHPHGIKVRLESGQVGRVQEIFS